MYTQVFLLLMSLVYLFGIKTGWTVTRTSWAELDAEALLPGHYWADSGSKWHHQGETAALISPGGSDDASTVFSLHQQWTQPGAFKGSWLITDVRQLKMFREMRLLLCLTSRLFCFCGRPLCFLFGVQIQRRTETLLTRAQSRSTASRTNSWCPTRITPRESSSWWDMRSSFSPSTRCCWKDGMYCCRLSSRPEGQKETRWEEEDTKETVNI